MNYAGLRVFITGVNGFLGSALASELATRGAEIHGLVRPNSDRSRLRDITVNLHEGDLTTGSIEIPAATDVVIHAVGPLGRAGLSEQDYQRHHVDATRNLMNAVTAGGGAVRVLHISSPGLLGPGRELATEDLPYAPTNPYERAKAASEKIALEFAARGLPVVIARPEFVYGPGDRNVLRLFRAIQGRRFFYIDGGSHYCHPTFVSDAVAGMLLCLESGKAGRIYHIAGPRPVTFRELGNAISVGLGVRAPGVSLPRGLAMLGAQALEKIQGISGIKAPLTRTAVEFFGSDRKISWKRAHDELGYTPVNDLATGIATTVKGYRDARWL